MVVSYGFNSCSRLILVNWANKRGEATLRKTLWFASTAAMALGLLAAPASAQELKVGDQAPAFTLRASDGKTYSLTDLRGKTVVLAWFPKAFTSG